MPKLGGMVVPMTICQIGKFSGNSGCSLQCTIAKRSSRRFCCLGYLLKPSVTAANTLKCDEQCQMVSFGLVFHRFEHRISRFLDYLKFSCLQLVAREVQKKNTSEWIKGTASVHLKAVEPARIAARRLWTPHVIRLLAYCQCLSVCCYF